MGLFDLFKSASPATTTSATPATKVGGRRRSEKRNRKNKNRSEKNQRGGDILVTDECKNQCERAGWTKPTNTNNTYATPVSSNGGKRRNKNRSEKRNRKNKNRRSNKNRKN